MSKKTAPTRRAVVMLMEQETIDRIKEAMNRLSWDNNPPNSFDRMVDMLVCHGFNQQFPQTMPMSKRAEVVES